ncbi:MAG: glycosyltransferase family 4 protein, partial [Ignavibacteria bacterium]|nr:glycosyltransferase family 4 protein [Ignavibacteria bacterium]
RFVSLAIEQYLVKDCDAYICVSNDDVKTAIDNKIVNKDKIHLIPNGINISRLKNGQTDRNLKARLGIKESDFVIGNISRFDEQKNQILLINAFPDILRLIPDAKLLLVGDGLLYDACMNRAEKLKIADNIIFAGSVPDPENYYPLMDLFVFPSKWEGLSITLIEAMASGKCIAASDIPSNRELITHGQNGVLFTLGSSRALARIISDLYKNPDFRNNLSENARKSSDNYDEKTMAEKISGVYKTLTER